MTLHRLVLGLFVAAGLAACGSDDAPRQATPKHDTVFQYSTLNALLSGLYDGEMTIGDLSKRGGFGLGTINGIDGELIALDGEFYSALASGRVRELKSDAKTPFAVVTRFKPERRTGLPAGVDYKTLRELTDQLILGPNHFQAIRINGTFAAMQVRSEPKQEPPYRPLAEVLKEEQVVFDYEDITGSMIGFRMPEFIAGVNVPGYHFHFISDDRSKGGHVLEFEITSGTILIDELHRFEMVLPGSDDFQSVNLGGNRESEVNAVEQR